MEAGKIGPVFVHPPQKPKFSVESKIMAGATASDGPERDSAAVKIV